MDVDSSSSSDEEMPVIDNNKVTELQEKITVNQYDYQAHVDLIKLLSSGADVDKCRQAREAMSKIFPLTPEMWLEWIQQERMFLSINKAEVQSTLSRLYSAAVDDYLSVRLWCQYCSDVVSVLEWSEEKTREVFEVAVERAGCHVTQGCDIWEQYRQFEQTLLECMEDKRETSFSNEEFLDKLLKEQKERVNMLFVRQLSQSLNGMEHVLEEYKTWLGEEAEVPEFLINKYNLAKHRKDQLMEFETALEVSAAPHKEEYSAYIEKERKGGNKASVVLLMERAITDNPLDSQLWIDFLQYLDQIIREKDIVLLGYRRAVRNIPWSAEVWAGYVLAQSRWGLHFSHIKSTAEEALNSGFENANSYMVLWRSYLTCAWRQEQKKSVVNGGRREEKKEALVEGALVEEALVEEALVEGALVEESLIDVEFQMVINFMNQRFGELGDPTGDLVRFMAECDCIRGKFETAVDLMNSLLESDEYKHQSYIWLEYLNLCTKYGSVENVRGVYQRAIQFKTDNSPLLIKKFLQFEAIYGSVESHDNALLRCKRIERKNVAQELKKKNQKKEGKKRKRTSSSSDNFKKPETKKHQKQKQPNKPDPKPEAKQKPEPVPKPEPDPEPRERHPDLTIFVSNLAYSTTEEDLSDTFKHIGKIEDIRLVKKGNKSHGFGYIEFSSRDEVLAALNLDRITINERPCFVSECKEKSEKAKEKEFKYKTGQENHKIFVSNLPYKYTEEELRELFVDCGEIQSVRMVSTKGGKFKGYSYVEFSNSESSSKAVMSKDQTEIGGRTVSVSISNPPKKAAGGGDKPRKTFGEDEVEFKMPQRRAMINLVPRSVRKR